jgi:hypothetical protein
LPTEHFLQLLSVTDYWYIVTLNSGGASSTWRREAIGGAGRGTRTRHQAILRPQVRVVKAM